MREPARIGQDLFTSKTKTFVKKIQSGSQHTIALTTDGKVFGWGDPESGKIGRMLITRDKDNQALRMERLGARNAVDIYCGGHHSFYKNSKGEIFSWGLNTHGQLGIGHTENTCIPTKIKALEGVNIKMIKGGEHHTIALTQEGSVYCWGKNDDG